MITKIARKEFTELLRDGRFRWTAVIVLGLLLVSLGLGWKNYTTVKREQESAQAESRRTWENQGERNPHSAAHFGVYAFKPKMPLSLVDSGLDNYTGNSIWVEAHYQNPAQNRPVEDATALQRFGELTAAGVLQLLVPLLIIFLTFDAFAGERASGTLRQILSLGVPRVSLVFGKILGVSAALLLLLIPAAITGVLALSFSTTNEILLSSVPRFLLMCLGYLLYFGAFIGIALTVSAFSSSVRTSLVILLAFWIFACLLVPRLANDTAENLYQIPSGKEFWEAVRKDISEGIDGHNPANKRTKELEQKILAQYGVSKKEDLPINFSGLSLNASEEYGNQVFDKHFGRLWQIYYAQERVQKLFGAVSPFQNMRFFSSGIAGTDLHHTQHFTDAVEQYRRDLNRELNLYYAYNSTAKEGSNFMAKSDYWKITPDFSYSMPDTSWAFSRQIGNLAALVLWCFGALGLSVWAANRMRAF